MAEIADAIEGQLYPMFCLEPTDHTCFADSRCGLQGFWGDVARAMYGSGLYEIVPGFIAATVAIIVVSRLDREPPEAIQAVHMQVRASLRETGY